MDNVTFSEDPSVDEIFLTEKETTEYADAH